MPGAFNSVSFNNLLQRLYVILFGSCLLLQQMIAFSHPSFAVAWQTAGDPSIHTTPSLHYRSATSFPDQVVCPIIDIEAEPTDSDESASDEPSRSGIPFSVYSADKEIAYSKALRIRWQCMASQSQRQEPVPVFILHHSWKAHLA